MAYKVYKTDEDKLKAYRYRISKAQRELDKTKNEGDHNVTRYENEQVDSVLQEDDSTFGVWTQLVPSGAATIDSLFAALTAVQPEITVVNRAHGSVEQRRLAETGIREVWNNQKADVKSEHALKDSFMAGIGWMAVRYEYEDRITKRPLNKDEISDETDAIYSEHEATGAKEPLAPEYVAEVVASMEKEVKEVLKDRIVYDYLPYDQVLYDVNGRTAEDIHWHCEIMEVSPHEVWDNPDYIQYVTTHGGRKKDITDIKPDTNLSQESKRRQKDNSDDDRITLYRMYDYDVGTVCTFAKEGKTILLEQPNPYMLFPDYEDRSPFIPLVMRTHPKRMRGISDMTLIEPLLDELNHYRSKLAAYIAQFEPKWTGPEDALTVEGKEAIASPDPGKYVGLSSGYNKDDVGPISPPRLPQEVLIVLDMIVNDIREVTGVSELMRGIFPDRKRTATETTEVVAASAARQSEKRNQLERFYKGIAKRTLFLMQLFYEDDRVSRLADLEGDTVWEWNGESIVMEADLLVELQPRQVKTSQDRKEDAQFLLGILGPLEEVDKRELAAFVLDEMGYDRQETRKLLKLDTEVEADRMRQAQQSADEAMAAQGIGPMDDAAAADALPPDQGLPPAVAAADAAGSFGNQATTFLPTP